MRKKPTLSLENSLEASLKLKILKEKAAKFSSSSSKEFSFTLKKQKVKANFSQKFNLDELSEEQKLALKRKMDERVRRKIKRRKCIATINWLKVRYPKCFGMREILPLKVGIQKDIIADLPSDVSISKCAIRKALSFYTRCYPYWRALVNHDHRYDLQGNPTELISKKHLDDAEAKLLLFLSNKTPGKAKGRKALGF